MRENKSFLLVEPCSRQTCCLEIKLQFFFLKYLSICTIHTALIRLMLRESVFCDGKTINSFNFQLYIKSICLQEKMNIKNVDLVFRVGELHVAFCALKVIRKLIDGSGLDQSFKETVNLIIDYYIIFLSFL